MTHKSNWLFYNPKADRVEFRLHGGTREDALQALLKREDHACDLELYEYSGTFRVRVTPTVEEIT